MEPFMTLTLNELIINFIQESIWNRSNKSLLEQASVLVRLCKVEFSRARRDFLLSAAQFPFVL